MRRCIKTRGPKKIQLSWLEWRKETNGVVKQLFDVLYVPDIKRKLLSISAIMDRDLKVHFDKNGAQILDLQGKVISKATRCNIYELLAFSAWANVSNNKLWHERFGHLNLSSLKEMHKSGMIADLPLQIYSMYVKLARWTSSISSTFLKRPLGQRLL